VSAKSGTSSLPSHLLKAHPELYASLHVKQSRRLVLAMVFALSKALRRKYPCKRGIFQDAVVRWVMEDSIPFEQSRLKLFVVW